MSYGLYMSALGAEAQNRVLQVVTNNLANVDTPGFKRELAVVQERSSAEIEMGLDHAASQTVNNVGGGVQMHRSMTDFSAGLMKPTGIPTDLALEDSKSFFLVEKDGKQLLTRAGNFHFTGDGRLVTPDGYAVLDTARAPLTIDPTLPRQMLPSASVDQPGARYDLAVVQPKSTADLVRVGENMFRALAPTQTATTDQRRARSGFLEQSGVQPTVEMMEMIRATRAYEANVRMIQNRDEVTGQLLNRVLRQ